MKRSITTADLPKVLGGFALGVDYTDRLSLQLTDEIDGTLLSAALEQTQRRYPYLSLRMRRTEESFCYDDDPAPIVLRHTDEQACLNDASTNHHLWAVSWNEDRLHVDMYHGIMDGFGVYRILSTLLYYYFAERYGISDHSGILTVDDPICPEETVDPFDHLTTENAPKPPTTKSVPAFLLSRDGGLSRADQALVWDIELPESAFMRFSSAHDASPGTMVAVLLSRALDRLFPERKKDPVCACMMNLRPMLRSETHHNCIGVIPFVWSERVRKMPFQMQCTVHRGTTFLLSDADRVRNETAAYADQIRRTMQGAPTLEAKKQAFKGLVDGGQQFTFLVSYVGKWKIPSLSPYIRSFYTHCPVFDDLLVQIMAVNGRIFLSFHQSFAERCVLDEFLRQLEENGVEYSIRGPMIPDNARFPEPERE